MIHIAVNVLILCISLSSDFQKDRDSIIEVRKSVKIYIVLIYYRFEYISTYMTW